MAAARALVKEGVYYREGGGEFSRAAFGEYDICRTCDGHVTFCNCRDGLCFTLTFDALNQYVLEGRISMPWGPIPAGEA